MSGVAIIREAVAEARHDGAVPRVHGNGFIQLDLSTAHRLASATD